jgi:mono/diheme cytochrome c family protein
MNRREFLFGIVFIFILSFSTSVFSQQSTWRAPAAADAIINPLKGSPTAAVEGKKTYLSMCAVCHGETGKGNGAASVALTPHPANFLAITIKNESDGAIFWKLTNGRPPMASYETLLTETQRWQLVVYIRQLEEKK